MRASCGARPPSAVTFLHQMAEREGSFAPSALAMVGVWAAAGAAVGALVDTYRQSERDIYRRTTAGPGRPVAVAGSPRCRRVGLVVRSLSGGGRDVVQ